MATPIERFLTQALKDYEAALKAQGKVQDKTTKNIYMRGARDFSHFLRTGEPLKRDERAPK